MLRNLSMATLSEIEKLALELPEQQRAKLASHILDSLPAIATDSDDGIAEATKRDAEMDENPGIGMSMDQFDQFISQPRASSSF
jgi:hypothetical protein